MRSHLRRIQILSNQVIRNFTSGTAPGSDHQYEVEKHTPDSSLDEKYPEDPGNHICLWPKDEHKYTLVWLHGLGDSAAGFYDLFNSDYYKMAPKNTAVILMNAPIRAVTLNGGMRMTSWYDIEGIGFDEETGSKSINLEELEESTQLVFRIMEQYSDKIDNDYSKYIVGGFSQGCCLAYNTFFRLDKTIKGLVAVSGHTPPVVGLDFSEEQKKIPIFAYHGANDPTVPEMIHRMGVKALKDKGLDISYKVEPGLVHSVSVQEISEVKKFLEGITE
ncbi:unnamed protein product [Moneuplotes crassus]|uniref:Phospholipase/carboxylesterase/thioesterase domain-containing protein n=1 Tax=Euplotes crassus TaxID=5936 RepID=A0AAD1XNT4_EUPCR|nr:unnamed protein product [Moneuplotes crassus]